MCGICWIRWQKRKQHRCSLTACGGWEYRGYDSAGALARWTAGRSRWRKCLGRVALLEKLLKQKPVTGSLGISHTRWATPRAPQRRQCSSA